MIVMMTLSNNDRTVANDCFQESDKGLGVTVAKFYNEHKANTREERKASPIFYLRNFNNWVKSVLINEFMEKYKRLIYLFVYLFIYLYNTPRPCQSKLISTRDAWFYSGHFYDHNTTPKTQSCIGYQTQFCHQNFQCRLNEIV